MDIGDSSTNEYFEDLNETIKEYFKVLSDELPDLFIWLYKYYRNAKDGKKL